jgi:hypothetical protein
MLPESVFLAHAPAEGALARDLAAFLESGCDVRCHVDDACLEPGEDLVEKFEQGLGFEVLVVLLSHSLSPRPIPRERWEPVFSGELQRLSTAVLLLDLGNAWFPAQVKRTLPVFDARASAAHAFRWVKRRIWAKRRQFPLSPLAAWSLDLEPLYAQIADRPGRASVSAAGAQRIAAEADSEFELVVWVHCMNRSLAQITGQIGGQLGVPLDGPVARDIERLRPVLENRRLLVILDAPDTKTEEIFTGGRSSYLITTESVHANPEPDSLPLARCLVVERRVAEAHEMFERLHDTGIETEACAREMIRILEDWGRFDYARLLREQFHPIPDRQMALFAD